MAGTPMKLHLLRSTLLLLNVLLIFVLLACWVGTNGRLRNIHWRQPEPLGFDAMGMVPLLPVRATQQGQLLVTLEKPLFSPSRRPPPPVVAMPAEGVAPPLTGVRVYGVYGAGTQGGAILGVDGKNIRLASNQIVKGWQLVAIDGNRLTFRRGASQHVLELVHYVPPKDTKIPSAIPPSSAPQILGQVPSQISVLPTTQEASQPAPPPKFGGIQSKK